MDFIPKPQGENKLNEKLKKIPFFDGIQLAISRFFNFSLKKNQSFRSQNTFKICKFHL